jgi:hypothetical protein
VPNPESMETSQWFTFSLHFLPIAAPPVDRPTENNGHHRLGREPASPPAPAVRTPSPKPAASPAPARYNRLHRLGGVGRGGN